jgi:mono/diheme cytochrome c family protein
MRILLSAFLVFCLFSCTQKKNKPILSADNLDSWFINVDQDTDTIFRTPKGALLKISKGSFPEEVELEVKEAYSMQDMLLGGLVTESDGQPLTSGGMIYINAKDGSAVSILKPITVALPTDYIDSAMQVYKSETDSINWKPVDTLPDNSMSDQIAYGKQLFMQTCATCHSLDRRLTGPALRGFRNRGNWNNKQEIYKWIRNPASYMASNQYAKNLQKEYGSVMQAFPDLTDRSIDAITSYIENAEYNPFDDIVWPADQISMTSDSLLIDSTSGANLEFPDKFCSDTIYFDSTLIIDTISEIDPAIFNPTDTTTTESAFTPDFENALRKGFTDKPSSRAYVFEIRTLGWYNIDAGISGRNGAVLSDIKVELSPENFTQMNVYIFFPLYKDLTVGQPHGTVFHFEKVDKKLPVFLGAQGVAIAFGSIGGEIYVGSKAFVASKKQEIRIDMKKSSKEAFIELIKENKIEGIDLEIRKLNMQVMNSPCNDTTAIYPK